MPTDGWHPRIMTSRHVVFDILYFNNQVVATFEAFDDDGPYYVNALSPQGEARRSGPMADPVKAKLWAEMVVGMRRKHRF